MKSEVRRGRKISSTLGSHEMMTICWSMEDNVFQIDIKVANNFVSVSPNSVTFWMEIRMDKWRYVLNTIVRNSPFFFFGFRLDRGRKQGWVKPIAFLLPTEVSLRIMLSAVNRNAFFGVLIVYVNSFWCSILLSKSSIAVSTSSITVSCIHNSPNTSHAPTHASVRVVEGNSSPISP